ncbi:MAG TPA: hypothetical protein PKA60_01955 [Candidatus Paceibacterota bacterium]|nr:hypothetical protein [Candidatus Paceibacterota bacterium]
MFNKKFLIIFLIIILSISYFIFGNSQNGTISTSHNNSTWNTYTNKYFDFQIDFPSNWRVYEDFQSDLPVINIYKSTFDKNPPFDYFSNADVIVIFPLGFNSEVLVGQIIDSQIELNSELEIDKKIEYVLDNNEPFASAITFSKVPKNWKKWGSVWSVSEVKNIDYFCRRDNVRISLENCNPFDEDVFARMGEIDQDTKKIQQEIIKSFSFIK